MFSLLTADGTLTPRRNWYHNDKTCRQYINKHVLWRESVASSTKNQNTSTDKSPMQHLVWLRLSLHRQTEPSHPYQLNTRKTFRQVAVLQRHIISCEWPSLWSFCCVAVKWQVTIIRRRHPRIYHLVALVNRWWYVLWTPQPPHSDERFVAMSLRQWYCINSDLNINQKKFQGRDNLTKKRADEKNAALLY